MYRMITCLLPVAPGCSNDDRSTAFSKCGLQLCPEAWSGGTLESTQTGQADALRVESGRHSSEATRNCGAFSICSGHRTLFWACGATVTRTLLAGAWPLNSRATAHGADASTVGISRAMLNVVGARRVSSARRPVQKVSANHLQSGDCFALARAAQKHRHGGLRHTEYHSGPGAAPRPPPQPSEKATRDQTAGCASLHQRRSRGRAFQSRYKELRSPVRHHAHDAERARR